MEKSRPAMLARQRMLTADVQKFVDLGLIEADDDVFADLDDRHAHLTAHLLHVPGGHRVFRDVDLLELDVMSPEVLHGPFAPAACGRGENQNFRLFLLFLCCEFFLFDGNGLDCHNYHLSCVTWMITKQTSGVKSLAIY